MNQAPSALAVSAPEPDFASLLKSWRHLRGMSQLSLALASDVSARHLGFLEVGRARPSRAMVLALTQTLELPLRERNQLLMAAGFAPVYKETPLADASLEPVRQALEFMLSASDPHPCFIVNRRYDVLMANRTARWLLRSFTSDPSVAADAGNMVRLLTQPHGMGPFVTNHDEVLRKVLGRTRRDLGALHRRDAEDEATLALAEAAWSQLPALARAEVPPSPMLGLQLRRGDLSLNLFTTIATLGTPLDVTLQEIRVETLFPSDAASRQLLAEASSSESSLRAP
ncbi:MAG: helix-turn-helix domain-containing protein [Rhizobacter sp.]